MKEFKGEISKIAKSAWVPTNEFIDMLSEQKGNEIKLQEIGKRANWVKLVDVNNEEATFERLSSVQTLAIGRINCFTTFDDWRCQRKH